MTVLFGTLGFRSEALLPAIKATSDVEKVVFYHDHHDSSLKAKSEVCSYCETLGIKAVPIPVDDAFDFLQLAKEMKQDVRRYRREGSEIACFNIAGGTKLMSSAALLIGILEGIPATYVHDRTLQPFHLPLLRIKYSETLTPKQREILRYLIDHKNSELTERELADAVGVKKATINHHVSKLVEKGVVTLTAKKGDRRVKVVKAEPAVELLLE